MLEHEPQAPVARFEPVARLLPKDAAVVFQAFQGGAQRGTGQPGVAERAQIRGMPAARGAQRESRIGNARGSRPCRHVHHAARQPRRRIAEDLGRMAAIAHELVRIDAVQFEQP